jgi:hypothetical protein
MAVVGSTTALAVLARDWESSVQVVLPHELADP